MTSLSLARASRGSARARRLAAPLALALLLCTPLAAQTTERIIDPSGDGVHALVMPLNYSLATDRLGNTYVAGYFSDNVFKLTPFGTITQIIGPAGDGLGNPLDGAAGVAVDGAGNVFVSGAMSHNVFRITPDGAISEVIDQSGDKAGNGLERPMGLDVDGAGNLYVTGVFSRNAFRVAPSGAITELIDKTGDGQGNALLEALDVAADDAGNAFVAGGKTKGLFKITPSGVVSRIIGPLGDGAGKKLGSTRCVTADALGNVYVGETDFDNVFKITPSGVITTVATAAGDGMGNTLDYPADIAVGDDGTVIAVGYGSNNAFRIETSGTVSEVLDATGDGQGTGFGQARGVSTDACGNLYVVGQAAGVFRVEVPAAPASFIAGQRLVGSIDPAGDVDSFSFYAAAGTELSFTARRTGKGSALTPIFVVTEPNGVVLGVSELKSSGKSSRVKKLATNSTGLHRVLISGDGTTGEYRIKTKAKLPKALKRVKETIEVGPEGGMLLFDGIPGMTVKSVKVKALKPKGAFAAVGGIPADLLPQIAAFAACSMPRPLPLLTTSKNGKATQGKNVAELTQAGTHRLDIDGGGTVGFAKVQLKLKPAKGKGVVEETP